MKITKFLLGGFMLMNLCLYSQNKDEIRKNHQKKDSIWTYNDRLKYSKNKQNSTLWDLDLLEEDIKAYQQRKWPTKTALSNFPSPVPKYKWGYCLLYKLKLKIGDKELKGFCIANAKDKYRVLNNKSDFYKVKFNILYLTDLPDDKNTAASVISRNYPHYMSTGSQKTSVGQIDWVQMDMADASNYAIINQRYFDLEFGKTIIIVPKKDGSLRFLQIDESIESFHQDAFSEEEKEKLKIFYENLKKNIQLFSILKEETLLNN